MTRIYVDATTLIALGDVGELDLLTAFDGRLVVVPAVRAEVTTQPAAANLDRFCGRDEVETAVSADGPSMDGYATRARLRRAGRHHHRSAHALRAALRLSARAG